MYQLNKKQGMGSFATISYAIPEKPVASLIKPEPKNKLELNLPDTKSTLSMR